MADPQRDDGPDGPVVTPEMIDAGEAVYREWVEGREWDYRAFIARLYSTMWTTDAKKRSQATSPQG